MINLRSICGDDAAKAVTSGYELVSEAAPVAVLVKVAALAVTTGDLAGELDKQHNPVSSTRRAAMTALGGPSAPP